MLYTVSYFSRLVIGKDIGVAVTEFIYCCILSQWSPFTGINFLLFYLKPWNKFKERNKIIDAWMAMALFEGAPHIMAKVPKSCLYNSASIYLINGKCILFLFDASPITLKMERKCTVSIAWSAFYHIMKVRKSLIIIVNLMPWNQLLPARLRLATTKASSTSSNKPPSTSTSKPPSISTTHLSSNQFEFWHQWIAFGCKTTRNATKFASWIRSSHLDLSHDWLCWLDRQSIQNLWRTIREKFISWSHNRSQ